MDFFGRESELSELLSLWDKIVYDGNLAPIVETDGYFDALVSFRSLLRV